LDIPAGQSLVLVYQTVVMAFGSDVNNGAIVDWTSLEGDSGQERNGQGCPDVTEPNTYCDGPAVAATATVDSNSIVKTIAADTFDTAPWSSASDMVARVGDLVTYRLAVNLSGGLTRNLRLTDQLPMGMSFVATVRINGDAAAPFSPPDTGAGSNFSYAPIATGVPSAGQTGVLTWTIGDVVNDPFGDDTTDTLEVVYLARILSDAGIVQAAVTPLANSVRMDYETAGGPAATLSDSVSLTVVQPELAIVTSAVADGGDTVLAADERITYTVDIINSGGGPAHDPLLIDTLPVGLRNGVGGVMTVRMTLLSGAVLPILAPGYDPAGGRITWDMDAGVADQYTIPAGDTLRIVYQVRAETGLGAGLTLVNQAQVTRYTSFDDEAVPVAAGATGQARVYGPTNVAGVTFTTDAPNALVKENPDPPEAAVGQLFAYRVTVPQTPAATALHDVRIVDDLAASAADLRYISVTKISGSQPWVPVNTGTATGLVIEDPYVGIDIPAGEQAVLEITVVLDDTGTNKNELLFSNTAGYTYNQIGDDPDSRKNGGAGTTADMTIVGADKLILEYDKSCPNTVRMGTPATYTLNFHNTSNGTVWNPTITERLRNQDDGGMCAAGPTNVAAWIGSELLTAGTDFAVTFTGDPACEWSFTLLSAAGGVPPDQRLIVSYEVALDPDTVNGALLTNVAGVTRWYSADPNVSGAKPHIFIHTPTSGTPGIPDYEDDHPITAEAPVLAFTMGVVNLNTGQDPGSDASPGDVLRYTVQISNSGSVGLSDFVVTNELDRLHG
ncbi:MAG: hypothetical protein KJP07_18060, partial [Desulfatitalea sp.]|nr:hypothetical protein [Desulfatitalea sp.]